jgi:L-asparaginase II
MNPILVESLRGAVPESFHRGVVCVVNAKNEVVFNAGDIHQVCYPRSAMKLFQVLPLLEAGGVKKLGLTLEEVAIMCGSHNGEAEHLRVVRSILSKTGTTEEDLLCGPQPPTSRADSEELVRAGRRPSAIHNNCSGKHAGMLALCMLLGHPTQDYISPLHPVQLLIRQACEEMYEYPASSMHTALDGCSAPIYSVPVLHQAIGYRNLVDPSRFPESRRIACKVIIEAMTQNPFMIAGTKRYCTDMLKITAPRVIGKTGADGVFCMAFTQEKLGVCIKIDDGKMGPQYAVAQALLRSSDLFSSDALSSIDHYREHEVRNFNKFVTGRLTVPDTVFSGLKL